MKKSVYLLFVLFFMFVMMQAQYVVYDVKGSVKLLQGKKEIQIKKIQNLQPTDFVVIDENSKIVLLDVKNSQRATLKNACAGSLSTLIANEEGSIIEATYAYLTHLLGRLRKSATTPHVNLKGGNIYRGQDGDSIPSGEVNEEKVCDDVAEDWQATLDSLQILHLTKQN